MIVKEIDADTFNDFANKHILKNFYQTKQYGELMSHSDFDVMYIGGYENDELKAGSLILYKTIGPSMKYGYAPRGFLIDYYDEELLKRFTKKVKEFFLKKAYAFIKINPEITYSKIDFESQSKVINNKNSDLIKLLKSLGYDKLKDNLYFESLLPKYTPVIYLPTYNFDDLDDSLIKSVEEAEANGLSLVHGSIEDIETFYKFIEYKDDKTVKKYKLFYEIFHKDDMADLLFAELNYDTYVKYLQKQYSYETEKNEQINKEFNDNPQSIDLYNKKMRSDQILSRIQSKIAESNLKVQENVTKEILGGAFVVKHQGRITILISGHNKNFDICDTKTFMYYKIIEEYKKRGYLFFDLYGITADYSESNPYKELNKFKLKFKPNVFEYIGEFDLIVNKPFHQILWSTNKIQKEFYRPAIKKQAK